TEIEDATPAAMVAHLRRRSEYDRIVEQYFAAKPDVVMGGGRANFLPKGADGSKRKDEVDFLARFREAGYIIALTGPQMTAAAADLATHNLLGLFALGNMDGVLDRKFLKGGTVRKFPEQPDLTEQVSAALTVLSRNESGFFLMVESGLIDKYTHFLDMERAVYDTIMLDNAVRLARDWASAWRRYPHPRSRRSQSPDRARRHDRGRHVEGGARRDAGAGARLRARGLPELRNSRCRRLPLARRREPAAGPVLRKPARSL